MKTESARILKKSDVTTFFATLARDARLIAPKQLFGGDFVFDEIKSPKDITWDYGHTLYPPKHLLLPHYEEMFRYEHGKGVRFTKPAEAPKQIIIGIRSCDVSAIRFQERFFLNQIVDPLYKARTDNTVLFSLVCNEPPNEECFCICCDAGPYLSAGFDVQLTDLGDHFLYEVGSQKGEAITEPVAFLLSVAQPQDYSQRRCVELHADSLFKTASYIAKAINYISDDQVPDSVWDDLGSTCYRCGACTNLCPVCTCFTVEDRPESEECFSRCRSWDSCQYSGFTREASGHNPRPSFGSRIQRRFYHKASYQYIMRDTAHGCVGCGRCTSACLTRLGVPNVVKRLRRAMHDFLPSETKAAEV